MPAIPHIKICGMRDPDNIREVAALRPEYLGFIFYPHSKRYVGESYTLPDGLPAAIKRVGVFVNALLPEIIQRGNAFRLDFVQLHGNESPEYCKELNHLGVKSIKAFAIDAEFDFQALEEYIPYCEYFLFDSNTPEKGGSGKQFDWSLLENYSYKKPFFLSGGIGPEDYDILEKMQGMPLHAIDINSRFEDAPALKNVERLKTFIDKIRS